MADKDPLPRSASEFGRVERSAANVIDNGDGTWSYPVPAGFDTTERVEAGAVTWRYARQASFPYEPEIPEEITFVVEEPRPHDPIDALYRTEKVDAEGRVWEVEDVDEVALASTFAHYDQLLAEAMGVSSLTETALPTYDYSDEQVGEVLTWQPEAWNTTNCSEDIHHWNTDDRIKITGSATDRQYAIVQIVVNLPNTTATGRCTGTMIDDDEGWVLTSAHCVNGFSLSEIYVCAASNNRDYDPDGTWNTSDDPLCDDAISVVINPDYAPSLLDPLDWSDDVALIEVACGIYDQCDYQRYLLGNLADSVIETFELHNLGLPNLGPGCTSTASLTSDETPADPLDDSGRYLYKHQADVTSTPGKRIYSHHDGLGGHSGSPLYRCGSDDICSSGEDGIIDGVWAGWDPVQTTRVSAKVSDFRSWAHGIID